MTPPVDNIDFSGFHRLIPSRFSRSGTVLEEISDSDQMLADLVWLDGATNDRIQGEQQGLPGISTYELVYGIPNAHIVNAAFTHTHEAGSRFNDYTRGAWYAADELETSLAEVTYHKARRLAEMVVPETRYERPDEDSTNYDDWLADFRSSFHALRPVEKFADCLKAEPVPQCYFKAQQMARTLLRAKSNGLCYPSVRRAGSFCVVCFRPALVYNPRRGARLQLRLRATAGGYEPHVKMRVGR